MDLALEIQELASLLPTLKSGKDIDTEEGAKHSLVLPFIKALGYNVFNPAEVKPELTADVGIKKGEKVDYAIMKNGKAAILFECKQMNVELDISHASQLFRYFATRPDSAHFAVLTNGIEYRFYSDLVDKNVMDAHPFFTFHLERYSDSQVKTLRQFSKDIFDENATMSNARSLKQRDQMRKYLDTIFNGAPPENFVRMVIKESEAYTDKATQAVITQFTATLQDVIREYLDDQVDSRLKSAIVARDAAQQPVATPILADASPAPDTSATPENKVVTTLEEMDAYYVVKSIVREDIPVARVVMRDTQSYCNVLIDDNNRKILCRFHFNGKQKAVSLFSPEKAEERILIATIDDIYQHAAKLKVTASHYASQKKE